MKKREKLTTGYRPLLAALLALVLGLSACAQTLVEEEEEILPPEPLVLTAALPAPQDTLDSARSTAAGGETVLFHLFENLMRWEDDGTGHAVLAPGQAERYTVAADYTGCATLTFTLREDAKWSDGQAVTADDFVAAWQRLADPAQNLPHRALLSVVEGYDQVQETGDVSLLAVTAGGEHTLTVKLRGSSAYFLEEVCASAYTMPVRRDLLGTWGEVDPSLPTNGPYTLAAVQGGTLRLARSETYYGGNPDGPETIVFTPSQGSGADYEKLLTGELDLMWDLPREALQALQESGGWLPEPVRATYGLVLNCLQAPFDVPQVRQAFRLAIDEAALAAALEDPAVRPAAGLVPYGVSDYSTRPEQPAQEEAEPSALPDAAGEVAEPVRPWDFRRHSEQLVTLPAGGDYAADCQSARELLAGAGYPGGRGFPAVEYVYATTPEAKAIALALQAMWEAELGVDVNLRAVSVEAYAAALLPPAQEEGEESGDEEDGETVPVPAFQIAAQDFTSLYGDANSFLYPWHSESPQNFAGYRSDAYDILLRSAAAAVAPDAVDARDAYLHDAEAILLSDAAVIPLCHWGSSYQLREGLTGLYRTGSGAYLLTDVERLPETPQ